MTSRTFSPPATSLRTTVAIELGTKPRSAARVYATPERWGAVFPDTIAAARVIAREADRIDVEVEHKHAGVVPNTLYLLSPASVGLVENKPVYDAWFLNEFQPSGDHTRYVVTGWVVLTGPLRALTPLLSWYVRQRMSRQMRRYILEPFQRACAAPRTDDAR